MIRKDKNLVFAALQVVALSLKGFNNGPELLIVGLVAGLGGDHLSRRKSDWMSLTNFGRWVEIIRFISHLIH